MGSFETKFLKKRFVDPGPAGIKAVTDLASPFVAKLNKPKSHPGSSVAEPVILSGPKGNSYSLAAAKAVANQSAHGASDYDEFNSSYGRYRGIAHVSDFAVAVSKQGSAAAYLRQISEVMDSEVAAFTHAAAYKLLGPVGGSIGKISDVTIGADGEMSLTIKGDVLNLAPGQILQAAPTDGSSAPTARAGLGYVFKVFVDGDSNGAHVHIATSEANATAGTPGIPSGWANSDFIFRNGDIATGEALADSIIRSYQAWITLSAATTDFNGVVRSKDSRYSGFRVPAAELAGMSILEKIQLLAVRGNKTCGAVGANWCVVGPNTWAQLAQEAQSYGQFQQFGKDTTVGVSTITVMTINGPTMVMGESHCQESDIWLFTPETLKLYNIDGFPALDDADGNDILRLSDTGGYEIRWHAFTCPTVSGRPHHNGRCDSGNV